MDFAAMQEVLEVYKKHGVNPENLYDALNETLQYANNIYWETCMVSLPLLYALKDVVWFNMEHVKNGGQEQGLTTLVHLGSRFPVFAKVASDDVYIDSKDVKKLVNELATIVKEWSPDLILTRLEIASRDNITVKPEKVSVVLYDPNQESHNKYVTRSNVLDRFGQNILQGQDHLSCTKEGKIGEFEFGRMLYATLNTLQVVIQRAAENDKGVRLDISSYENM